MCINQYIFQLYKQSVCFKKFYWPHKIEENITLWKEKRKFCGERWGPFYYLVFLNTNFVMWEDEGVIQLVVQPYFPKIKIDQERAL